MWPLSPMVKQIHQKYKNPPKRWRKELIMDMNLNSNNGENKTKNKKLIIIIAAVAVFLSCSCCCCGSSVLLFGSDSKNEDSDSSSISMSESSESEESQETESTEIPETTILQTETEPETTAETTTETTTEAITEPVTEKETEPATEEAVEHRSGDNIVGISNRTFSSYGIKINFQDHVQNDVTGNWRLAKTSDILEIENFALDYYNNYFENNNEIHAFVNSADNTTTRIEVIFGDIYVTVFEYVKGEEHDANELFGGGKIADYMIHTDNGDIERLPD